MILSNVEIIAAMQSGRIRIDPLASKDPALAPFNTTSVDLRLAKTISIPQSNNQFVPRPSAGGLARLLAGNSQTVTITEQQPFLLKPNLFILGQTIETVDFPIPEETGQPCYAARVEGKSSLARYGLLVHFTAPTIHAGFRGPITLEIINLGPYDILLEAQTYICQLIIEEVKGIPVLTPSQFRGQTTPTGA